MTRTQIQFPDPLYRRLKQIAELNDWSLADVVRRATELYVRRFPEHGASENDWSFPTINTDGDYLVDPADSHVESDAIAQRSGR
jgi:hypothetical protein